MVTIAASTRLCAQVPSDWVGEEGSTVSPNIILYLVGWLPEEIHFIRCRSVCMCLSILTPEILGSSGCQSSMSEGQWGTKKAKKSNCGASLALWWQQSCVDIPEPSLQFSLLYICVGANKGNKEPNQGTGGFSHSHALYPCPG